MTSKKKRLFVDLDGTLARFHDQVNFLERMFEKNFFRDLQPFENMVEAIRQFIPQNSDVEVFILSARVIGEPPYCEKEKNEWVDEHLPEIDLAHRIYTDPGKSKAEYIPGGVGENDYLLDDYNKGLNLWLYDGGSAIKCHNNINQRGLGAYGGSAGQLWTGSMVHTEDPPELICAELCQHMGLQYDLNPVLAAYPDISHWTPTTEEFHNPLNFIRYFWGDNPDFKEIHIQDPQGNKLSIPLIQADAISQNLYGCSVQDLYAGDRIPEEIAADFRQALEESKLPVVGSIHYLGSNGQVGETAMFHSVEEMRNEIADCNDCGRPITVDWFVQPKVSSKGIALETYPDVGAPSSFLISADNLGMAAEVCGIPFDNVDAFLAEYTWDDSLLIWEKYAQHIEHIADIMKDFSSREEVEEEFFDAMCEPGTTPEEAAISMLSRIENWARWQNKDALDAGVLDKAIALRKTITPSDKAAPNTTKLRLDSMISAAEGKKESVGNPSSPQKTGR